MTLAELSSAWNVLRNAALGRGTTPKVSARLGEHVGIEYEAWRAWLSEQGALEDWVPSVTASSWVDRYRALWKLVDKEGKAPASTLMLEKTPLESAADAAKHAGEGAGKLIEATAGWVQGVAIAVAAALAAAAVILVARGRR